MIKINYPASIKHALRPTAVEPLTHHGKRFDGVDLWIKRDDLTGFELSGNKVRKLEFSMAAALEQGANAVVTCGGVNSNHCRATTFLARRLGLDIHLFLRTPDGQPPQVIQGNTLLNQIAGARIHWIDPDAYLERDQLMREFARRQDQRGRPVFVIPEGASDALGAFGFVRAAEELQQQLQAMDLEITHVVSAVGSGGTVAGLSAGRDALGVGWQILGFAVCDDEPYFHRIISGIRQQLQNYGLPAFGESSNLVLNAHYQGRGYGLTTQNELIEIAEFARSEGILLDPCYTGKAFIGMNREIEKGTIPRGSRVLFWHTGGALGNFSYEADWARALEKSNSPA
ncbi:1-aminocyclopropane-1-carboxylate deaminase/D-cysteine desulfhydrase [Pseudomonadota bacterium]